jgi:hypothetical protein
MARPGQVTVPLSPWPTRWPQLLTGLGPHGLAEPAERPYLRGMKAHRTRTDGFVDPCIPTRAAKPPSGRDWVHEIKHDGYRLIVRRDGEAVRLFTRRGHDWTDRYPAIAAAAAKLQAKSFTLDGEAVVAGADGVAVFDALHRRGRVSDAILQAFDLLELDGVDYRPLPLSRRKDRLARHWPACRSGSSSTSTPTRTAPWFSCTPARWASKASCRSGSRRPTDRGRRGTGSRSRTGRPGHAAVP